MTPQAVILNSFQDRKRSSVAQPGTEEVTQNARS
jgi:hypothetical protein